MHYLLCSGLTAFDWKVRWECHVANFREGIQEFAQAIQLDPGNALYYYQRGRAYADGGNALQALKDWDVACGLEILDQIQ